MPGPPPKPPAQRRRRNAAPATSKLPAAGRRGRAPTLPGADHLLASTIEWWKTAWRSPMATVWLAADRPALVRLALLIDLTSRQFEIVREGPRVLERAEQIAGGGYEVTVTFDSPVTAAHLAEIRQLEDRLGLSPLSRRRLQWEIAQAASAGERDQDGAPARGDRYLQAIQGGRT